MVRSSVFSSLLVACGFSTAAYGEAQLQTWGQSGDWTILVDENTGNGCLIQRDFAEGVRIRLGYVPDQEGGFFAALSRDWQHIKTGEIGIAKFISDKDKFAGEIEMIEEDGWYGGWAFFNNPEFTEELAQRRSITVIGPQGGTFDIDLTGSARAIREAESCQLEQDSP